MCVGCRTKKSVAIESVKQTYNSEQVTTERNEKHISLIDTTNIDELTSVIREFVFDVPCLEDSFAPPPQTKGGERQEGYIKKRREPKKIVV